MFELVKELKAGAENLKKQSSNYISLNAGCELFIEFVTLFPHDASVSVPFRFLLFRSYLGVYQEFLRAQDRIDTARASVRHPGA